jgi:glucose/mannose-6-phosphate isomerase
MKLDDFIYFSKLDPLSMYSHITSLPIHLETAWKLGHTMDLPKVANLQNIVVTGMGGSAIGADLAAAYALPVCSVPVYVVREYDLPAWVKGPSTLVIASSHSGNTEETLSAFKQARERGCSLMAVCTGGELAELARSYGAPAWIFEHVGQPRAAVGFSFGLLLAALARLGVIPDPAKEFDGMLETIRREQMNFLAEIPTVNNPAKRLAGQLVGRWVMVIGSNYLAPVARRWKGQVSENGKAWGQFEFLPECDHNTLAGTVNPAGLIEKIMVIFLQADSDHPRNKLRFELTRKEFMVEGLNTETFKAVGDTPLAQMWTTIQFGDFLTYYLAIIYDMDPTAIASLQALKKALA